MILIGMLEIGIFEIMTTLAQKIIDALTENADSKRLEFNNYVAPTKKKMLGVTSPELKQILTDFQNGNRDLSARQKIEIAIELVHTDIFECAQLAYELVGKDKKVLPHATKNDIELMNYNLDNWASVDCFGMYVYGKAWRIGTLTDADLIALAQHENFWQRRLAVVSTVPLNQKSNGGTVDVDRTLMICELLLTDKNDLVVKALSWALRELAKREPDVVESFVFKHKATLHPRVIREVRTKIYTGKKNIS